MFQQRLQRHAGTGKTLVARALAAQASKAGKKVTFFMRKVPLAPASHESASAVLVPEHVSCRFTHLRLQCDSAEPACPAPEGLDPD